MNKKIKIYIFSPYSNIGGDTLSLSRLIRNLNKKKYDISFVSLKGTVINKYVKQENLKIVNLNVGKTIFSIFKLTKIIKKDFSKNYKKYIFLSNQNFANIISVFVKKILNEKIKLILVERNHLDEFKYQNSLKNKIIKYLIKKLYKNADAVIGISKKLSVDLSKLINKKVFTIYNPSFDKKIFQLSKNKVKYSKKKNLILSVGRFENQKDPITILKAFRLVNKKLDANLLMIGFGSKHKELRNFIKNNNLEKSVELLINISNPYPFFKFAKLFVLASKYEGFGNVLVEAGMFKIPIISSKCNSGPLEILDNGKGGDLFKIGDYKELSRKMLDKLKNKNSNKKVNYLYKSLIRFNMNDHYKKYNKIFNEI